MSFDYQVFMMDGMTKNETVTVNEDGSYTIFINRNLCESKRLKAFNHAIKQLDLHFSVNITNSLHLQRKLLIIKRYRPFVFLHLLPSYGYIMIVPHRFLVVILH